MELESVIQDINDILKSDINISLDEARNKIGYRKTKFTELIRGKYKFNRNTRQYEPITENEEKEVKKIPNKREIKLILTEEQQKELIELLEDTKVEDVEFKIEMPLETKKNYKVTTRINNVIWEKFNKFCKKKKYYSQKDHLGRALIMYMKNTK